jgi:hypothetical protein
MISAMLEVFVCYVTVAQSQGVIVAFSKCNR